MATASGDDSSSGSSGGTAPSAVPVTQSSSARPDATAPAGTPAAKRFDGVRTVGALFFTVGGKAHFCTASVVDSAAGDLVITAAHCVYSQAHGYAGHIEFVPGYHDGKRPYGAWAVRKVTVASGWRRSADPNLDVAFLAVGPAHGTRIQSRTGGLRLGIGRRYEESLVPVGYNDTDDGPVKCRTKSFKFRPGQLEFYCHNFWDGTSGGPWITGFDARTGNGMVIGVIGGYEQGGDYEWASYSPYFGSAVSELFRQAGGGSPTPNTARRAIAEAKVVGQRARISAALVGSAPARAVPTGSPATLPTAATTSKPTRTPTPRRTPTSMFAGSGGAPRQPRRYVTLVPYISPRGSARSSRRTPSGSRKYMDVPLASWYGTPASSSLRRR